MPPIRHTRSFAAGAIALFFAITVLVQTAAFRRHNSVTVDETFYVACGQQTVHDGRLDRRISEFGVAPLPLMLHSIPAAAMAPPRDRANRWRGEAADPPIVDRARMFNSLLVGVPLVLSVFFWLLARRGLGAAAVGGAMMAFSPTIVAHSALATTDAAFALFSLPAMLAISRYLDRGGAWRFVLMGLATGAALSAKYSAVFLFPVVLLLLAHQSFAGSPRPLFRRIMTAGAVASWKTAVVLCVALVTLWGACWFSATGPLKALPPEKTPESSRWVKILGTGPAAREVMGFAHSRLAKPAPLTGILCQLRHNRRGHLAYLAGEHSPRGWWYYFPIAWLLKSTPAEVLLGLAILPLALIRRKRCAEGDRPRVQRAAADHAFRVWMLSLLVFWLMVCQARLNIGQRYVLVLYPLTVLIAIDLIWSVWRAASRRALVVGASLVAVQIASAASIAPHYLAYFTPFVGGPSQGRHYLVDSNLDWGQGLIELERALDGMKARKVLLQYFGTAAPAAYGLNCAALEGADADRLGRCDAVAISVTHLQGVYVRGDPFAKLRKLSPDKRAGHAMFVYDLGRPEVRSALSDILQQDWAAVGPCWRPEHPG